MAAKRRMKTEEVFAGVEQISEQSITDFGTMAMTRYATAVNLDRSVPELYDGLKPVQRKVAFTGIQFKNGPVKSARVTGTCAASYHPHGSAYQVIVNMVHANVPLFVGIGNWGGLLDPAAAERYTNCCLSEVGWSCFDPDYMAVADMVPNYDDKETEPVILPVKLPFILLNGAEGIGVGVTCKLPTFTIESVRNVLVKLFSGEKMNHQMMAKILKPQLKWGGSFVETKENREQWLQLMKTGRAAIQFQSELRVDYQRKEIYINEWPGSLNPEKFIAKVKQMPQCVRAYNYKGAVSFKIEARKALTDAQFNEFVNKLQKLATVSISYRVNVTHRVAKTEDGITTYKTDFLSPGISELILRWSRLRIELEHKVLDYRINKQQQMIDHSSLLIYACSKLQVIFEALKQSEPETYLMKHLEITEQQAKTIFDLKVRQLSKLDQSALKKTLAEQKAKLKELQAWKKEPKPKIKQDIIDAVDAAIKDKKNLQKRQDATFEVR